jgi:hypothetical protein
MKQNIKFGIGTLLAAMLLMSMAFVPAVSAKQEKDISGDVGILALQYSESINEYLGPQPETYTEYFPVESGANEIEVRLLVTDFDSGDYGKIRMSLYNNNNQLVASDTLYIFENYLNVNYKGSISPGNWHIVVSVDDLGANTINVAGNINVFE